jgi:hypothetical protein
MREKNDRNIDSMKKIRLDIMLSLIFGAFLLFIYPAVIQLVFHARKIFSLSCYQF